MFRKETFTSQYLNFSSNHPLEHKRGVVYTLLHKAEVIASDPNNKVTPMIERTRLTLDKHYARSYLSWLLYGADTPPPDQPVVDGVEEVPPDPAPDQAGPSTPARNTVVEPPNLDKTKKRYIVVIPYMKGVSEQVRRVMNGYGLKMYFKPTNMFRQILVQPKDKVIKARVVYMVYHISCDNCDDSHIGEQGGFQN